MPRNEGDDGLPIVQDMGDGGHGDGTHSLVFV